jgi:hypothetical protein
MCQTAWINDADDFCLWAPPNGGSIGAPPFVTRGALWC